MNKSLLKRHKRQISRGRDAPYSTPSIPKQMIGRVAGLFAARCPYCGSIEFRSVGVRNAVERAINWLLQPYRCSLCGRHIFLFRWQVPAVESG